MDEKQRVELKDLIEGELSNLYDDLDTAKNDLNVVAKSAEEKFGIKASKIKRMVKHHFEANYEEKKNDELDFYKTFEEIMLSE